MYVYTCFSFLGTICHHFAPSAVREQPAEAGGEEPGPAQRKRAPLRWAPAARNVDPSGGWFPGAPDGAIGSDGRSDRGHQRGRGRGTAPARFDRTEQAVHRELPARAREADYENRHGVVHALRHPDAAGVPGTDPALADRGHLAPVAAADVAEYVCDRDHQAER